MIIAFSEALQQDPKAIFSVVAKYWFDTPLGEVLLTEEINGRSQVFVPFNPKGVIVIALGLDIAKYVQSNPKSANRIHSSKYILEMNAEYEIWRIR